MLDEGYSRREGAGTPKPRAALAWPAPAGSWRRRNVDDERLRQWLDPLQPTAL